MAESYPQECVHAYHVPTANNKLFTTSVRQTMHVHGILTGRYDSHGHITDTYNNTSSSRLHRMAGVRL
ncbi:hypothetical protein J6590_043330 [Homalodisca vitripennis]|nr:hypothetical protein J6590_043330 [Homalodisca vitripennis]